ncbi:MAG: RNA polymerase sigma factor SigZ [Nitrospiria bacterium]
MTHTEKIWQEYHTNLRRFIQRRMANEADVDDLLQDVFIKIHSGLKTLKDSSRIQSWLYQITRNAIIDYNRRHKPTQELLADIPVPKIDDNKSLTELATCVRPMIETLSKTYREAVALVELQDLTQKEVAEKLGLSLSGAKSRVQRGRAKLKQMLMDCCQLEFDHRGSVVDFSVKDGGCKPC